MIFELFRKLLGLTKNDSKIQELKNQTEMQTQKTYKIMDQTHQKIMRTQTYYFGKGLGIIKPKV